MILGFYYTGRYRTNEDRDTNLQRLATELSGAAERRTLPFFLASRQERVELAVEFGQVFHRKP